MPTDQFKGVNACLKLRSGQDLLCTLAKCAQPAAVRAPCRSSLEGSKCQSDHAPVHHVQPRPSRILSSSSGGVKSICARSSSPYSPFSSDAIWPCASAMLALMGCSGTRNEQTHITTVACLRNCLHARCISPPNMIERMMGQHGEWRAASRSTRKRWSASHTFSSTLWVPGFAMYSRILATAAGIGPAIAVFTRVTISDSRAGDANACITQRHD